MTDSEIIKGLEICSKNGDESCRNCPYWKPHTALCIPMLQKDALKLIEKLMPKGDYQK